MNKSCSPPLIRILLGVLTCALFSGGTVQGVRADAAPPPDPTVGALAPYQPQKTNVQMMSENVLIDVLHFAGPDRIKVSASFTMQNQGRSEEKLQVIFPLTRLNYSTTEESLYSVDPATFVARVDGQAAATTEITTPLEGYSPTAESGFLPSVVWAAFEVVFPADRSVLLQVEYDMDSYYPEAGFSGVEYILETGAGWYGPILSADLVLRLPYPATAESVHEANPGQVFSGNEVRWKFSNLEPTRADNLAVSFIDPDVWMPILELRSRVERNPVDADAWAELGDRYMQRAMFTRDGYIFETSPHFTELALAARQKAVELRPEWGNAHYKLAEILWLGNPAVKKRFGIGPKSTALVLDDPAIQQALSELEMARTYGLTENVDDSLYLYINQAFPDLKLAPAATATAQTAVPTQTLVSISTATVLAAASPVTVQPVSPTPEPAEIPSPANYAILMIGAVSLAIIVGLWAYRWISRTKG